MAEPRVHVTATTPDGEKLGEWDTYEDGRHVRTPQLDDDVVLTVTLPPTTEEWAEDAVSDLTVETERDDEGLHITYTVGGNTNAISCAQGFLRDLEECFSEVNIDPMAFTLKAFSRPRGS